MSENQKQSLNQEQYHIRIDSTLLNGSLTYGEIIIPGDSEQELFFSTYICHQSMASNELSGPVVQAELINSADGLSGAYEVYKQIINTLESNYYYQATYITNYSMKPQ